MISPNYSIHYGDRAAYFVTREDAELFWSILRPLFEQGKITNCRMYGEGRGLIDEMRS